MITRKTLFTICCSMIAGAAIATVAPLSNSLRAADHDAHPEIHAAMDSLRVARNHLDKAADVYGGHRVTAAKLVDQAIAECDEGIKFANK